MNVDLFQAVADHGQVGRVVVASVKGSAPRTPGTSMVVWPGGQYATIGGGALEYQAADWARDALRRGHRRAVQRVALGPKLNQCCGGAVTLLYERIDADALAQRPSAGVWQRCFEGSAPAPNARRFSWKNGWLSEPVSVPVQDLTIYGAGHVGFALAHMLEPFAQFRVTLADDRENYGELATAQACQKSPDGAAHLIVTHDHALDLSLCHRLLLRETGPIGLIGSATKWARFRSRLEALDHRPETIARITCPIGEPALGKAPADIALGVVHALLRSKGKALS